jgi:hypothetical protein
LSFELIYLNGLLATVGQSLLVSGTANLEGMKLMMEACEDDLYRLGSELPLFFEDGRGHATSETAEPAPKYVSMREETFDFHPI